MTKLLLQTLFLLYTTVILLVSGVGGLNEDEPTRFRKNKPAKRLFVFGDSYADTGNTAVGQANSWKEPYGMTFPGKPSGRFSDGRVLTDFIAKFLGFTAPIPYKLSKLASHRARHGVNFAYGGTGALDTLTSVKLGFPNMTTQIDLFEQMLKGNDVTIDSDLSDSVAFVSLVGNDYNTYLKTSSGEPQLNVTGMVGKVVGQLAVDLKRISGLGVKKTFVTGLQPLGCLPQITWYHLYIKCNKSDNVAVEHHNSLLKKEVDEFNHKMKEKGHHIYILDLFNAFETVLFKEKHGKPKGSLRFKDSLQPCCSPALINGSCSDVDEKGQDEYSLCGDPAHTFFWDAYHPTQAGWRAVFNHLKDTFINAFS